MNLEEIAPSAWKRVCAVSAAPDGGAVLYLRTENGSLEKISAKFRYPFLHADAPEFPGSEKLAGSEKLNALSFFDSAQEYRDATALAKDNGILFYRFREDASAAMMSLGFRLFHALEFHELVRMQIGFDEERKNISLLCGSYSAQISCDTPETMLAEVEKSILTCDPDVIEGEALFSKTLPFLVDATRRCHGDFAPGRAGGKLERNSSRFTAGGRAINCTEYTLAGRHLIDLDILAQIYDGIYREFEEYSLDYLAGFFNLKSAGLAAVRDLVDMWLPSYFYRARILPVTLQQVVMRGNGMLLDMLLVDAYCRKKHSVPLPDAPQEFEGALSRSESSGVFRNVLHCDVRSLYPSVLLANGKAPAKDKCGIFLGFLETLRRFRLEAKDAKRNAATPVARREADALQSAFKILINSFYGYLGFPQGSFNDFALASEVTSCGRAIMNTMLDLLRRENCPVIELDTDGIYFQLPPDGDAEKIKTALDAVLPAGIAIEFDPLIPAMFSYKSKNYALLDADGDISITGAALKSRALEAFQREAIQYIIHSLLNGKKKDIPGYFAKLRDSIANRTIALEKLAKSETLNDSVENYRRKLASGSGRRSAAYELLLAAGIKAQAGSKVRFYVTGEKAKLPVVGNSRLYDPESTDRDENVAYYLEKCRQLEEAFKAFWSDEEAAKL